MVKMWISNLLGTTLLYNASDNELCLSELIKGQYNKDLIVSPSTYGEFSTNSLTKATTCPTTNSPSPTHYYSTVLVTITSSFVSAPRAIKQRFNWVFHIVSMSDVYYSAIDSDTAFQTFHYYPYNNNVLLKPITIND